MNKNICLAAFAAGLVAVLWVGFGYIGAHPLALTMTALIAAVYVFGALELKRFHAATESLTQALAAIPENLTHLGDWLAGVHPSLQNPVRLRIEGERVGMPGPVVTPYLVGLLVMLGMLGTFLGMVVTLNGAVLALESTTDLQTIRAALAAPVKGLGLAFGTSVAGVAASAMLGLISSLCRRERLQAGQLLDTRIATVLRGFSLTHQRQETFKALQAQAQALPDVVGKLEEMMGQMARNSRQLDERLLAGQETFHREAKAVYADLARSVDLSLRNSLTESARAAGATLQPVAEATMAGIARETAALHERMAVTVAAQLDGLSSRFDTTLSTVADTVASSLEHQAGHNEQQAKLLQDALAGFSDSFAQQSTKVVADLDAAHGALRADLAVQDQQRQAALAASIEAMAASLRAQQDAQAARDAERQAELSRSLEGLASTLQQEWQQAGAQTLAQQQQICRTLEESARTIAGQAQTHATETIDEIARLMQTAAEAPRVAAEVIGELRKQLSQSVARDNELLEERSRVMETLSALLDAINHASVEQRTAIDALVASSSAMLERVGSQFAEQTGTESARLVEAAAQMSSANVEAAAMGDAFGAAVQQFAEANEKMIASLQRIETSLDRSMTRSDEQLAYYVAQARELIDLSVLSQKQIVADLQQRLGQPALVAEAA